MKNFLFLLIGCFCYLQLAAQNKESRKVCIDRETWEACETGQGECLTFQFVRNSKDEKIDLVMPCGSTFTTVHLYASGTDGAVKTISIGHDECPPVFDLTEMADGEYTVYMLSCGLGGGVNFVLKTK